MEFNLTKFLPSNWLHAVGATLFHSLWLGVILSFIVAIILFSTRKTSAALRYNLLTASLSLFVLTISILFYNALGALDSLSSETQVISAEIKNGVQANRSEMISSPDFVTGFNQIMVIWNAYAAQIVIVWFFIICIKSAQLLVGLNGISHLKHNKVYAAGRKWDEKISQLSDRLGISQKVNILQSGMAQVPMVVGHFKPLVLIPLGLLNGLSDSEVEAILCHELAHIKRRDYLVNLMQSFIEIVFFFNPAVLWISKLIREERENCCDDLAVSQMADKRSYVKALITCQEFQLNAPSLAMAVTGKKNHLFNRISRMLFDTKTTLNKMEKTILTVTLVSVVICSAAFKNVAESGKSMGNNSRSHSEVFQDTTKKKIQVEIARKQANSDRQQAINDAKQAQVDSKQAVIDSKQFVEDAKQAADDAKIAAEDAKVAKQDALQAQIDAKIAYEEAKMHSNGKNLEAAKIAQERANQVQINTKIAIKQAHQAQIDAKIAIKNAEMYKNNNQDFNVPPTPSSPAAPAAPPVPPLHGNQEGQERGSKTKTKTGTQRTVQSITSTDSDVHDYKSIIKDMIKDGIIKNQNKLSYKLDKNALIVNGVKQTEDYHKKYKSKFLQRNNAALLYQYETNSSTVTTP